MKDPTTNKQAVWQVSIGAAVAILAITPIGIGYVTENTSVLVTGLLASLFGWIAIAKGFVILVTPKHIWLRRYYVGFVFKTSVIEMSAILFVVAFAIVLLEVLSSGERSAVSVVFFAAFVWLAFFMFMRLVAAKYDGGVARQIEREGILQRLGVPSAKLTEGKGNSKASIIIVSVAPGEYEWPYQEQAHSQLFHDMCSAANISRKSLYFTHVVKYRPPGDRGPAPQEIRQFWPYLLIELKNINPKIVITTGQRSLECFVSGASLSEQHGKLLAVSDGGMKLTVVPLYHPTDVIADATLRKAFIDDFVAAVKRTRAG